MPGQSRPVCSCSVSGCYPSLVCVSAPRFLFFLFLCLSVPRLDAQSRSRPSSGLVVTCYALSLLVALINLETIWSPAVLRRPVGSENQGRSAPHFLKEVAASMGDIIGGVMSFVFGDGEEQDPTMESREFITRSYGESQGEEDYLFPPSPPMGMVNQTCFVMLNRTIKLCVADSARHHPRIEGRFSGRRPWLLRFNSCATPPSPPPPLRTGSTAPCISWRSRAAPTSHWPSFSWCSCSCSCYSHPPAAAAALAARQAAAWAASRRPPRRRNPT